jgi:sugar phosphate isomerase/epimerase
MSINFDPSHLVRMGIDPLRFLDEFIGRIRHVHAKDTALDAERLYEFGHELPATFSAPGKFGGLAWRYTIPGRGAMNWTEVFARLARLGYAGRVSVELEDDDFNGTDEGEKSGLLIARKFLESC